MELSEKFFTYNGTSSRDYGLMFAHVDTDPVTELSGGPETITVYSKQEKKLHYIGESYADAALSFEAEVVVINSPTIKPYLRKDIERWLFHQQGFCKLYVDDDCGIDLADMILVGYNLQPVYLNCRFVNPERIEGNGGLVGYKFTVECDSALAWQDPIEVEYELSGTDNMIEVNVDTDTNDYVYPKVTIGIGTTGGDISIINMSDDVERVTGFTDLTANITFTMNGDVNYISGDNYTKFSNRNFIRLLDGENQLSITGDVISVKVEFQNQRYM